MTQNWAIPVNMIKGWAALQKDLNRQRSCAISDLRSFQDMTEKSLEQPALNSMLTLLWEGGLTRELPVSLRIDMDSMILSISYSHGLMTGKSTAVMTGCGGGNHLMPHQTDYNVPKQRCLVSLLQRPFFKDMKCG